MYFRNICLYKIECDIYWHIPIYGIKSIKPPQNDFSKKIIAPIPIKTLGVEAGYIECVSKIINFFNHIRHTFGVKISNYNFN